MTPSISTDCDVALDRLRAATQVQVAAAANVNSGVNSLWDWMIGSDSSAAALSSEAHSAQVLLAAMEAKRGRISTDDEGRQFITDCGQYADVRDVLADANMLTASGGITTIAKDSAHDLAAVGMGTLELALVGIAIVAVILLVKR